MLTQLTIQNFAIVKFLELELRDGMSCITGETGAGKSIAIDALGLCLGERAEAAMVRPGAERSEICARFNLEQHPQARAWLASQELETEDECLLRRVITAEGRSRAYINGTPVPLALLKQLGQLLVNIHGQHAHQLLLKSDYQLAVLDAYAGHQFLLDETRASYQQWRNQHAELNRLKQDQQERDARQQLLEYQVQELDDFALQAGEYEEIESEHSRLANRGAIVADCQFCLDCLYDNEEATVSSLLNAATHRLDDLTALDEHLQPVSRMLQEALIQIQESHHELRGYMENLELDPERFAYLEERLSKAMELARKHHVKPQALAEHHQQLATELSSLTGDDERIQQLLVSVQERKTAYIQASKQLSASRQRYADELGQQISSHMQNLSMPQGQLQIQVQDSQPATPTALGMDHVEFMVSTNPGQPLMPLGKVASGGELSRISLAIQVITAQRIATPTLIFDEVDVGISGPTAAVVGKLLRQLGTSTQVLVVTHLPQVAGQGHQHYHVSKQTDGLSTETCMRALDEPGRLAELARLLGGDQITANTLANARELLNQAA